jgi:hypothetical protein
MSSFGVAAAGWKHEQACQLSRAALYARIKQGQSGGSLLGCHTRIDCVPPQYGILNMAPTLVTALQLHTCLHSGWQLPMETRAVPAATCCIMRVHKTRPIRLKNCSPILCYRGNQPPLNTAPVSMTPSPCQPPYVIHPLQVAAAHPPLSIRDTKTQVCCNRMQQQLPPQAAAAAGWSAVAACSLHELRS